jgi:hypothetical protein
MSFASTVVFVALSESGGLLVPSLCRGPGGEFPGGLGNMDWEPDGSMT